MPLPLIVPIAIGGVALATGGGLTINARRKIKKAIDNYEAAYKEYVLKYERYEAYHDGTEQRLQELGRVRVAGMEAVREAIDFIKRAKLANPEVIGDEEVKVADLETLDQAYGDILKTLAGGGLSIAGGTGAGALTALGAYGLVGALGTASTGAAIGGLSGAAASSATLAWFGGGAIAAGGLGIAGGTAVLGSIVAAPIPVAIGAFQQVKARRIQRESEDRIRGLKLKEAEIRRDYAKLSAVRQRCEEVQRTISDLIEQLQIALQNASPNIAQDVYRVVQIAKTLRAAIDEPVVPERGC